MKANQLLPVPPGLQAIYRYPDVGYRMIPAACIARKDDNTVACLVFDRWGTVVDPTEEEFFIGWAYKDETLETRDVREFIIWYERVHADDPGNAPSALLPDSTGGSPATINGSGIIRTD